MAFNRWRDYLGLVSVIQELREDRRMQPPGGDPKGSEGSDTETSGAPGAGQAEGPPEIKPSLLACTFCRHNGESRRVYSTHRLKDAQGRVQCPVLRHYVCPQCQGTGDRAHTLRFCPLTDRDYTSVYRYRARNASGRRGQKSGESGLM